MSQRAASVTRTGLISEGVCAWDAGASNQNLFRSKGYVGREIRRRRSPECRASHFGCNPAAQREPTALSKSMELFSPDDGSPNEETMVMEFCGGLPGLPFLRDACCLARVLSTLPGPTS